MQFPTVLFTAFFLIMLCLWWSTSWSATARTRILIGSSMVFYACAGWWWVGIVLGVSLITWMGSCWIEKASKWRSWRAWCVVGMLVGHLAAWKYTHWVLDLGQQWWGWNLSLPNWAYPAGLSFFTFHGLALVCAVWQRRQSPLAWEPTLAQVSFFPCLLAGPVLQADSVAKRLTQPFSLLSIAWSKMVWWIAVGMALKWVLSTQAAMVADPVFQGLSNSTVQTWWGVHAYAAQIFFDFAGYSLMAIGVAGLLGFVIPDNFRQPYLASSAKEFWSSWHRSLSFFFRDHVYIDLFGGNQHGKAWAILAAACTMLISGLWHGANVTFIIWGVWHAAWLVLERLWPGRSRWPRWLGWIVSIEIVVWGWVWFRAENIDVAYDIFAQGWSSTLPLLSSLEMSMAVWTSVGLMFVFAERTILSWGLALERVERSSRVLVQMTAVLLLSVWAGVVMALGPEGVPPFIYNGF